MGSPWPYTSHGSMSPTWKTVMLLAKPTAPGLRGRPKAPFSNCNYKFFPSPPPTNPLPDQVARTHTLLSSAQRWPSPSPDLCPGSPVGKRSWLFFCPLNYSHPNLGHWHYLLFRHLIPEAGLRNVTWEVKLARGEAQRESGTCRAMRACLELMGSPPYSPSPRGGGTRERRLRCV